jgi:TM2 domain-containing membrane protein YozV
MCQTVVSYPDGFAPVCGACGYAGPLPASAAPAFAAPKAPPSMGLAVAALVLNLLVWPGLGTMIGGRIGEGLAQGLLVLLGVLLLFTILLIPLSILLFVGMWVWGLVSGVQLIQQANARPAAPLAA